MVGNVLAMVYEEFQSTHSHKAKSSKLYLELNKTSRSDRDTRFGLFLFLTFSQILFLTSHSQT